MRNSNIDSDNIDLSQQIDNNQVENLQVKQRKSIQFSQERNQMNSNYIKFTYFYEMVKDIPIDYPYVLEYFNLNIQQFPENEEILNIQKVIHYRVSSKIKRNWTKDEQKLLIWIMCKYAAHYQINIQCLQDKHFQEISNFFLFRNLEIIKQKWNSYMKINLTEKPFTEEEDINLIELHDKYQFEPQKNIWALIAGQLNQNGGYYRSSKQLRERWINYLDPSLLKINLKWTDKEDLELINQIKQKGRKWTEIAKCLQRNENQVKNRYISLIKRENLQQNELDKLIDKLLWKISKKQQDNEEIIEFNKRKQINHEILHLSIHQLDFNNPEIMSQTQLNKQLTPCLVNISNNKIYFPPYDYIKTIIEMQQIPMRDDFENIKMQIEKFDQFEQKLHENQYYRTSLSIIEEEQIGQFNSDKYILVTNTNDNQNEFGRSNKKNKSLVNLTYNQCDQQYACLYKFRTEYIIRRQMQKQTYRSLPQIIFSY